ncbi:MAG: M20/M25/M40 family metallo-hydrolase [Acidobacteria bacterium]|nr:M20/M25/M40 family metallo-hydrolase [Acidobacteriota bacterium]
MRAPQVQSRGSASKIFLINRAHVLRGSFDTSAWSPSWCAGASSPPSPRARPVVTLPRSPGEFPSPPRQDAPYLACPFLLRNPGLRVEPECSLSVLYFVYHVFALFCAGAFALDSWLMKRILLMVSVAVFLIASVALVRTFRLESRQIRVEPADPAPVDVLKAAEELSRALRFRTISYENRDRIDRAELLALHGYLAEAFPAVHKTLEREEVNELSLLYTWRGSDPELRPALLSAHLDVVPVEEGTEQNWVHPPYSGAVADGFVWGRGAIDDKGSVITILHAVESLVSEGFHPRRTLYLAFGHDEEIGGYEGAKSIATWCRMQGMSRTWCPRTPASIRSWGEAKLE